MSIKVGWWDASLMLWDFSRNSKHCIHLSTIKIICFSRFMFSMSAFAPIKISYSNSACNKSAVEAWIWLVSFYSGEWWRERLHCRMLYFLRIITFFFKTWMWHHIFSISFNGSKFNETWKRIMFIIYVID